MSTIPLLDTILTRKANHLHTFSVITKIGSMTGCHNVRHRSGNIKLSIAKRCQICLIMHTCGCYIRKNTHLVVFFFNIQSRWLHGIWSESKRRWKHYQNATKFHMNCKTQRKYQDFKSYQKCIWIGIWLHANMFQKVEKITHTWVPLHELR